MDQSKVEREIKDIEEKPNDQTIYVILSLVLASPLGLAPRVPSLTLARLAVSWVQGAATYRQLNIDIVGI